MKVKITLLKRIVLNLFSLLFCTTLFAQVGINTTTPDDGSLLDIESFDKGIFIPRVDIVSLSTIAPVTGVTATVPALAAAESLLVYNTNVTTGEGFYYWSGTVWVALSPAEDGDFHQEGTSTAPTAITQDVFRTGNVAIGKITADYPLDIENTSNTRALNVSLSGATDALTYSVYAANENTSDNHHYGIYSLVQNNTGTGNRYGMYNKVNIPGTQTNQAYGIYNDLTAGSGGNGAQIGTFNRLAGNVFRAKTGVSNYFTGTDNSTHIGVNNNIASTGTGIHTGTQNQMAGSGTVRGVYNTLGENAGNGLNRGTDNTITNNGSGVHQGMYSSITGTGSGEHTGVSNYMNSSGNGVLSGTINSFGGLATGTGIHRGTYNNVSGAGTLYGVENNLDGTGSGQTAYGTFNDVNSDNGTNIAGWFDAHGTGATYYAAVFNRGGVVANETGGDYDFRIEGQTDVNLFFADASADMVGIGNNAPGYTLDVTGDIHFSGAIYNSGALQHADYVFETYFDGFSKFNENYKMMPLKELESFLKKNKYLPSLQSRADVLENGWNVSRGVRDNLEKVEELFLHTIEASKKIDTLQKENKTLKSKLDQTLNALEALNKRLLALEKK